MKYKLSTVQLTYFTNFLTTMANSEGLAREQRRNFLRLANKFAPPRIHVDLKPGDRFAVINIAATGLSIMVQQGATETDENKKQNIEAITVILDEVRSKLSGEPISSNSRQ